MHPLIVLTYLDLYQHERKKSGPVFRALNYFPEQFCGTLQLQSQAHLKTTSKHSLLLLEC